MKEMAGTRMAMDTQSDLIRHTYSPTLREGLYSVKKESLCNRSRFLITGKDYEEASSSRITVSLL